MIPFKELSALDLWRGAEEERGGMKRWRDGGGKKQEPHLVLCLHLGAPGEAAVN